MKVIYAFIGHDETRTIAEYLYKKKNWIPIAFQGPISIKKWQERYFPESQYLNNKDLRRGNFNYNDTIKIPVDSKILEALSKYETSYLALLEDTTGHNFSLKQRQNFYYQMLNYWNSFIIDKKPDIYILYTLPHTPSDYALYLMCKHIYNIPVVFLDFFDHFNLGYRAFANSLENLSKPFMYYYRSDESKKISNIVKRYVEIQKSNHVTAPRKVLQYYENLKREKKNRHIDNLRILKRLITFSLFKKTNLTFKKNYLPITDIGSQLNEIESYFFKKKLIRENRKNFKYYNSICNESNFKEKTYIYFPAPYQPEATGNLILGVYQNIFLLLDLLFSVLPEGWFIVYKEHPNSFSEMDKGALERNKIFYKDLRKYKDLIILKSETSSFDLIDNSKCLVTAGGTAGWEASIRGKPSIVFGNVWYSGCDSVFSISNRDELKVSIDKINKGYLPDINDIKRYAQAVYMSTRKLSLIASNNEGGNKKIKNINNEMEKIAEYYYEFYNNYYCENKTINNK